jgi:hypothetical protein
MSGSARRPTGNSFGLLTIASPLEPQLLVDERWSFIGPNLRPRAAGRQDHHPSSDARRQAATSEDRSSRTRRAGRRLDHFVPQADQQKIERRGRPAEPNRT